MAGAEIPSELKSQKPTGQNRPEKDSRKIRSVKAPDCGNHRTDHERTSHPVSQIWDDDDSSDSRKERSNDNVGVSHQTSQNDSSKDSGVGHGDDVLTDDAKKCNNLPIETVSVKMEIEDDDYNPRATFHNPVQPSQVNTASEVHKRKMRYTDGYGDSENEDNETDNNSDFSESEGENPMFDNADLSEKLEIAKKGLGYKEGVKADPDFVFSETGEIRGLFEEKHQKATVENPKSMNDVNLSQKSSLAKKGLRVKYAEKRSVRKGYFQLDDQLGSVLSEMFQPYVEVVHELDTKDTDTNSEPVESHGSDDIRPSPTSARDTYRCQACGFTSKCLLSVCRHVRKVELYDPSVCSECGEMLPNKCQLNAHKRQVHENFVYGVPKEYRCSYEGCKFTNRSPSLIQKHIATKHENKREYPCSWEGCG